MFDSLPAGPAKGLDNVSELQQVNAKRRQARACSHIEPLSFLSAKYLAEQIAGNQPTQAHQDSRQMVRDRLVRASSLSPEPATIA